MNANWHITRNRTAQGTTLCGDACVRSVPVAITGSALGALSVYMPLAQKDFDAHAGGGS